jgi:hypothetical protein
MDPIARKSKKDIKNFHPAKIFPVCTCPTPLLRYAKNTLISCGVCDAEIPKNPPHEAKGGRAGTFFYSGFFYSEKFSNRKKSEKLLTGVA